MPRFLRPRWIIPALLLTAAAVFFGPLPAWVEADENRIDGQPLIPVSDEAKALHASLTIVDLHSDTLMWRRDMLTRGTRGHEDLPRMAQGNVALQVFSSVTKTPRGQNYDANGADTDNITPLVIAQAQPLRTWTSLAERSLWHGAKLDRAVAASGGALIQVAAPGDIDALLSARAKAGQRPVGTMLSVEGLQNLEGRIENLARLYEAGVRMAGLTHFFDNDLAGSMHGLNKGGLTPFGRQVIGQMEARGMIVDIAHCSHACVGEVLAMARRPVVSSHGGVQATCAANRNLNDAEIKGLARTGGVIGIGFWDAAICDTSPRAVARAMKHVRDTVGIQYVALGSDFDGATTVRFDAAQLVQVTQALLDAGFTADDVRAAMGGNALRVLRAGIEPMKAPLQ